MRRLVLNATFAAIGLALLPVTAQAWWASNRHEVLPVSDGVWEVVGRVGSSAQDYWCGIGDFAITQLRTSATQRIYILEGIGPSVNREGRKSVKFTLTRPQEEAPSGYSLSIRKTGENLNAATARYYCFDRLDDPLFRRP